jgi:hypothetical protein
MGFFQMFYNNDMYTAIPSWTYRGSNPRVPQEYPGNSRITVYRINMEDDSVLCKSNHFEDDGLNHFPWQVFAMDDGGAVLLNTVKDPAVSENIQMYYTEVMRVDANCNLLGVKELNRQQVKTLNVYPNPATSTINVSNFKELKQASYTVSTVTGQQVLQGTLKQENIEVNTLPVGHYILTLAKNGVLHSGRFVKQ